MTPRLRLPCALAIALGTTAAVQAGAQAKQMAIAAGDTTPQRVSMTVSGGVSLGSYQAGATWAFIYVLRNYPELRAAWDSLVRQDSILAAAGDTHRVRDRNLLPPRQYLLDVLTGASAGNANAVFAATEYCAAAAPHQPEESLFWKAWIPIGFRQLTHGNVEDAGLAVFSRKAFDPIWATLAGRLARGNHVPTCDLLIGITTTKLTPHVVDLATGLAVPVQRFAGVFRLVADSGGPKRRLTFTLPRPQDVLDPELSDILILDPRPADGSPHPRRLSNDDIELDFTRVQNLVEASGSFPVAFAPRRVSYRLLDELHWQEDQRGQPPCLWRNDNPSEGCDESRNELFVDGGVFDNRPLNLALGLSRAVEEAERRTRARREEAERAQAIAQATAEQQRACVSKDAAIRSAESTAGSVAALDTLIAQLDSIIAADSAARADGRDSIPADSLERVVVARADAALHLKQMTSGLRASARDMARTSQAQRDCAAALAQVAAVYRRSAVETKELARLIYFVDDDARRARAPEPGAQVTQASRAIQVRQANGASTRREPQAGIAAALRVVSSAFQTSQNGELRLFASRIGDEHLGVNSRYPRLMAEHIGHFGAFLAQTFREHDFYAGVYDGLRSAFRELYCGEQSKGGRGGSRAPHGRTPCEVAWIKFVLEQRGLALRPEGKAVVERIFADEERAPRPAIPPHADQKTWALATLVDANVDARAAGAPKCTTTGFLIEDPLCNEQLLTVMDRWRKLLKRSPAGTRLLCHGVQRDPEACRIARDARAVYHEVTLEVLARLWRAEAALDRRREKGYPGPIGLPLFAERAFSDQFRSCSLSTRLHCATLNPTSSDVLGGTWHAGLGRALPATVAGLRNGRANWLEWRPTLYIGRGAGFTLAAIAPVQAIRREGQVRAAMGGGLTIMPPLAWITSISVSRIGEQESVPTTELTAAFLSGVIRIGLRDESQGVGSFFSASRMTAGVGDANGLSSRFLVWAGRGSWRFLTRRIERFNRPPGRSG